MVTLQSWFLTLSHGELREKLEDVAKSLRMSKSRDAACLWHNTASREGFDKLPKEVRDGIAKHYLLYQEVTC